VTPASPAERARSWRNTLLEAVCDAIEPWEHGRVFRASARPSYWDFNVVIVEGDPEMSAAELIAFADEALAGLEHRRVDFADVEVAARLRPDFEEAGWETDRLVWMLHGGELPPGPAAAVTEVAYDDVIDLRRAWYHEDFPGHDPSEYFTESREISLQHGARVLASIEDGVPIAYAQLEVAGDAAEIVHVYVHPEHRGGGRGTALTRAAVQAADDVRDLWIVADDEGRPKELYERLGFRPAWTAMEFLRLPPAA
jgi:ribosomal protein S18 acetylase RimI-like enzyme